MVDASPSLSSWKPAPNVSYPVEAFPAELQAAHAAVEGIKEDFLARVEARRTSVDVPDHLYQYTDVHGLFGICQHQQIWLCDAAFMNDPLEGTWVHHLAMEVAEESLKATAFKRLAKRLITPLLAPLPDIQEEAAHARGDDALFAAMELAFSPAFIASFTTKSDQLSQWRGYGDGGAGASVGFDLRDLSGVALPTLTGPKPPKLFKIEYDEQVQRDELTRLYQDLQRIMDQHEPILENNIHARSRLTTFAFEALRAALNAVKWEFKSPHYSEEAEWRLCFEPGPNPDPEHRVSRGLIIPYFKMDLPKADGRYGVKDIILGPKCAKGVGRGLGSMFKRNGPIIKHSKLAFR